MMNQPHPTPEQRDERVSLPLDQETALRALLKVDPNAAPVEGDYAGKDSNSPDS